MILPTSPDYLVFLLRVDDLVRDGRLAPTDLDEAPSRTANHVAPASEVAPVATPPGSRSKGLCANCARRLDCRFPASESGVWFCEEYL